MINHLICILYGNSSFVEIIIFILMLKRVFSPVHENVQQLNFLLEKLLNPKASNCKIIFFNFSSFLFSVISMTSIFLRWWSIRDYRISLFEWKRRNPFANIKTQFMHEFQRLNGSFCLFLRFISMWRFSWVFPPLHVIPRHILKKGIRKSFYYT